MLSYEYYDSIVSSLQQCLVPLVGYAWCYALSVQVRNACDSDLDDDCDIDGELVMV